MFTCSQCPTSFKNKTSLKEHVVKHHIGIKNFSCDTCGKEFYSKQNLRVEERLFYGANNDKFFIWTSRFFQCCGSGFIESGSRVLMTKKMKEKQLKFLLSFFYKKITIYLSLGLHKRTSRIQEEPLALKREHSALQKMKFINCFLFFWVIFALLDPDPDCEFGSGYRDPIESGSNPQQWFFSVLWLRICFYLCFS
jgi:hypothetical protein